MFQDRIPRAGDVVNASKDYYFANSIAYHDLINSMIYFGDPALKLRLPEGDLATSTFEVSDATAGVNTTLDYTVTVKNTSVFTVTHPVVEADYPEDWTLVSNVNGGANNGDTLTWTLPDMLPGSQHMQTFSLTTKGILPPGDFDLTVPADISSNMAPTTTLQVTTVTHAEPDLSTSTLAVSSAVGRSWTAGDSDGHAGEHWVWLTAPGSTMTLDTAQRHGRADLPFARHDLQRHQPHGVLER